MWPMKISRTTPELCIRAPAPRATLAAYWLILFAAAAPVWAQTPPAAVITLDEALAARQDVWGLAAMREPNGPSYQFFEKLLPPLRYVNAEFRYYPIVLSAPNATQKARLTSNGSGLNARANLKTWKEVGVPVTFHVGEDQHVFGEDLQKLDGPHLEQGYLPIVKLGYEHGGAIYEEEAFAGVEPMLASNGVVFVRFGIKRHARGIVSVRFDADLVLVEAKNSLRGTNGLAWAIFDGNWEWHADRKSLEAKLKRGDSASLAIPTKAIAPAVTRENTGSASPSARKFFPWNDHGLQRKLCIATWQNLLNVATQIAVPEPLVNHARRALLVNNFMLLKDDRANYSWGNQYERLYQAECGDTARAFLLWGYDRETLPMLSHQFDYTRAGLEFHNAGFKLQQFSHYYWMTRDTNGVAALRPKWEKEIKLIVGGREKESGLFPKERYCGDIAEHVYSLNPNAGCWRGLRDFAAVLDNIGEKAEAKRLTDIAIEFRTAILKAVEQSEYRDAKPPFIPIMFFGKEKPYEDLTSTMVGSYWNLLAPYVIGSGVFGPPGCERERWMVDYFQEHGGICMGMVRFHQHSGLFACEDALDDLYGLRYSIKLLQLDEVDRALVSFYGKLAQGLTRETFIGAEGTGLRAPKPSGGTSYTNPTLSGPSEEVNLGRPMYLPPNSTAQGYFLWMLRYLVVQDWDMDDDGTPETLRLCFATPKRWLEDGREIKVERALTAFGLVSLVVQSRINKGEVTAKLELPTRNAAKQTLLRIRVPHGWRVISAKAGSRELEVDEQGTADVSMLKGKTSVRFRVAKL
jgi:hypothetical protein